MLNKSRRGFRAACAAAVLLMLAIGSGCTGFFVNPTLTTLTIGPTTPTIQQAATLQMAATGTYNDGSTQTLTGTVLWSTSDPTIATISSTGLITGVAPGTATITAQSGTISGSTTVTVSLANITSIALSPTNSSTAQGDTLQFTATATTADGQTQDITSSASWNSSNTTAGTIDSTGLFTAGTGLTANQTTTITATEDNITGSTTLTVTTQ